MRVSVCLLPCLLFVNGCFLDHGAPDGRDPAASAGAALTGICSLSAAAIYPKSLTLFRMADCHEATPVDACEVAGPVWDGLAPNFEVSTSSVTTPDEGPSCDTLSRPVATAACYLPIEGVGSYLVTVDARDELMLNIPYDSSAGASCWTFGGECETGTAPIIELPTRIASGEAVVFEMVTTGDLDAPRPEACIVSVEDGGATGWTDERRVSIRMRAAEESLGCIGGARRVRCLLPPLEPGEYVVEGPDSEERMLSVD